MLKSIILMMTFIVMIFIFAYSFDFELTYKMGTEGKDIKVKIGIKLND